MMMIKREKKANENTTFNHITDVYVFITLKHPKKEEEEEKLLAASFPQFNFLVFFFCSSL